MAEIFLDPSKALILIDKLSYVEPVLIWSISLLYTSIGLTRLSNDVILFVFCLTCIVENGGG